MTYILSYNNAEQINRRCSQVVRQGIANLLAPVRIWVPPQYLRYAIQIKMRGGMVEW